MEFQQSLSLLAARPPHSHEDCEDEKRVNSTPLDVKDAESKTNFASEPAEDLMHLSTRQLIQAVFQLQEMRVLIYTDFRESVLSIVTKLFVFVLAEIDYLLVLFRGFQAHQKTQQFPTFCKSSESSLHDSPYVTCFLKEGNYIEPFRFWDHGSLFGCE